MLSIEALYELGDGDRLPVGVALGGRVFAVPCSGDDRNRTVACLLTSEHSARAKADPPRPTPCAVLNDVTLAPARQNSQAKARQFAVPHEVF
jgi:hypothetical protein